MTTEEVPNPHIRFLTITHAINAPPTARAGDDQSIRAEETVMLDGSASFDDNTAIEDLLYAWTLATLPLGSSASFDDSAAQTPTFIADLPGTYIAELVVTDEGGLSSAPDSLVVSSDNLAPTADAGADQLVIVVTTTLLDGSASSDPENDPISYAWSITSAPVGSAAALSGAHSETPSFAPDVEGPYTFTLSVSDAIGPGSPDTVEIVATTAETFAEILIVEADELIEELPPGAVTNSGNQSALGNFLIQAIKALQKGNIDHAIEKLEQAFVRTDGCVLRGAPDGDGAGRDWMSTSETDPNDSAYCSEQKDAFSLISAAIDALRPPIDLLTPLPTSLQLAVTQGPGGDGMSSHSFRDLYYSWDLDLIDGTEIIGTPVLSVAAGVVVFVEQSVPDGTPHLEKDGDGDNNDGFLGNVVTIKHEVDGKVFYSSYFHLEQGSVPADLVPDANNCSSEKPVGAGEMIGVVGNTGSIDGTHLHFTIGDTCGAYTDKNGGDAFWYQVAEGDNDDNGAMLSLFDFVDSPTGNGVLAVGDEFTSSTIPSL